MMAINRGWTVRVTTTEMVQGSPVLILYAAGFQAPTAAEDAVRDRRSTRGERYRALDPITDASGPIVSGGEVRELW